MTKTKQAVVDYTQADISRMVSEVAAFQLHAEKFQALMNKHLDEVRATYEPIIKENREKAQVRLDALEQWAEAHKDLFKEPRSMEFARGTIGFRKGQWQVKTRKGFTWKKVIEVINETAFKKLYLREKAPEVNKDAILADREKLTKGQCETLGILINQEDAFFCEVKKDDPVDPVKTTNGKEA